jgi:hypothetical protein
MMQQSWCAPLVQRAELQQDMHHIQQPALLTAVVSTNPAANSAQQLRTAPSGHAQTKQAAALVTVRRQHVTNNRKLGRAASWFASQYQAHLMGACTRALSLFRLRKLPCVLPQSYRNTSWLPALNCSTAGSKVMKQSTQSHEWASTLFLGAQGVVKQEHRLAACLELQHCRQQSDEAENKEP